MKYSSLSGSAVVDGYKGRPPTKKAVSYTHLTLPTTPYV